MVWKKQVFKKIQFIAHVGGGSGTKLQTQGRLYCILDFYKSETHHPVLWYLGTVLFWPKICYTHPNFCLNLILPIQNYAFIFMDWIKHIIYKKKGSFKLLTLVLWWSFSSSTAAILFNRNTFVQTKQNQIRLFCLAQSRIELLFTPV